MDITTITFEWEITINIHVIYNNPVILRVTSHYINVMCSYIAMFGRNRHNQSEKIIVANFTRLGVELDVYCLSQVAETQISDSVEPRYCCLRPERTAFMRLATCDQCRTTIIKDDNNKYICVIYKVLIPFLYINARIKPCDYYTYQSFSSVLN